MMRSPACTITLPVRPEIGARMVQYSRLSVAFITAAESARTAASSASASARAASSSCADTRFCPATAIALVDARGWLVPLTNASDVAAANAPASAEF